MWTHVTGMRDDRVAAGSGGDVTSGRRRAARAGRHESCRTAESDCVHPDRPCGLWHRGGAVRLGGDPMRHLHM